MVKYLTILLVCVTCFAQDRVPGPRSLLYIPKFSQGTGYQKGDGNGGFVESGSLEFNISSNPNNAQNYYTNYVYNNLAVGTNDLFTVAAGYRVWINNYRMFYTNGNQTFPLVKTNGSYYGLMVKSTSSDEGSQSVSGTVAINYIFSEGETLSLVVVSNTVKSLVITANIFSSAQPIKTIVKRSFAVGDNTLYTVPSNKMARPFVGIPTHDPTRTLVPYYFNGSGSSIVLFKYFVPSGQTTSAMGYTSTNTIADFAQSISASTYLMYPGDSIVINVSTNLPGQSAWVNIVETDL